MSTKLFGTDGIRARAGEFPLNAQTVAAIGRAIGEKLAGKMLVGQDTRMSSPWIFEHLQDGHLARRRRRLRTPVSFRPRPSRCSQSSGDYAGGVMISASHNPYEDNGIKVFASDGTKLNDADES